MSASDTDALNCGLVRSLSVAKALLEELELELELDEEPELVGPPPIHWPTAPFKLAIVPLAGATSVAAARLFCAVCNAASAPATWALAASRSDCAGGASVCAAVAYCVCSAA